MCRFWEKGFSEDEQRVWIRTTWRKWYNKYIFRIFWRDDIYFCSFQFRNQTNQKLSWLINQTFRIYKRQSCKKLVFKLGTNSKASANTANLLYRKANALKNIAKIIKQKYLWASLNGSDKRYFSKKNITIYWKI